MALETAKTFFLILGLLFVVPSQVACTTTPGAPKGDDAYDEDATGAMEEEEDEDAWGEANR